MSTKKEYTNEEVTIVWQPDLCSHSANCVKGLPDVFDTKKRPWINAHGENTQAIIDQVKQCPSGALTTYQNNKKEKSESELTVKVSLAMNGPILVKGPIQLENAVGEIITTGKSCALCRCGGSANKPFCDGTHNKIGFTG